MVSSPSTPSSSAVTIPIPGKSILKRPPPTNQSLLSRITRFLPNTSSTSIIINPSSSATTSAHAINNNNNNNNGNTDNSGGSNTNRIDDKALKRAHFILPEIAVVYPISSLNPPSTPQLKEEKKLIEDREKERRRKILRGSGSWSSSASGSGSADGGSGGGSGSPGGSGAIDDQECYWSMDRVESFYRECCAGCDEAPDSVISAAFKNASSASPRCVDLSGIQLNFVSASILSDVFTIEWGLRKLSLRECDLDDVTLKPILHSLLIPGSLSYLSVAHNKRMKSPALRLIGAYAAMAKSLQFLDVSQNSLDKKSVEYIVSALTTAPEPGLVSLRMDDCQLRPAALETLCRVVRTSSLRNISLRFNRISASGAVALALMIRDYPDVVPAPLSPLSSPLLNGLSSSTNSSNSSLSSLLTTSTATTTPTFASHGGNYSPAIPTSPVSPANPATSNATLSPIPPFTRAGPILPPPRHPTTAASPVQTTYTPYVPRSKRHSGLPPSISALPLSPTVPIITSSSQGGVTARHVPPSPAGSAHTLTPSHASHDSAVPRHASGPSAALLDKVRALDALPRLGALRTLDLKGNELRNGITYISQVLKRNRTLKVLNLSENKLDVQSLVMVAEALKYNSCLETLDLSKNPCSGPGLEGIQSLRTAFTLNTALKRLFLSGTQMTSAGAIALAEFLPESMSLLHLDLTNNILDIAGVMALSSGLKANHVMRCLDLNIPENDHEFSRMCREILTTCVRNTEEAENAHHRQNEGAGRGIGKGIWGMIGESSLARSIRLTDEKQYENDIIVRVQLSATQLDEALAASSSPSTSQPTLALSELADRARSVLSDLTVAIQDTDDPARLQDLLRMNDRLLSLLARVPISAPNVKKPALTLQGLKGLGVYVSAESAEATMKPEEEATKAGDSWTQNGHAQTPIATNGPAIPTQPCRVNNGEEDNNANAKEGEEDTPTTPRFDKGKAKADPEPEEPEKILKPAFLITESSEDEDEETHYEEVEGPGVSPTDRSRIWVAEEGEIFRKGTVLLGPEELEGEYDSEDLRRELLEAMVERPPPRPITDEYGLEIVPVVATTTELDSAVHNNVQQEAARPPPKPYIPRRASLRSNSDSPLQSPVVQSENNS